MSKENTLESNLKVSVHMDHIDAKDDSIIFEKAQYKVTEYLEGKNYGKFEIEPLERGFGHTLGNALRRVMLSSLPGDAVKSVYIEGILHEFQTLEGVVEDVTSIILNLKRVVVKKHTSSDVIIRATVTGEGVLTAGDIIKSSDVEVINAEQEIATLSKGGKLEMELTIGRGRGYIRSDENKKYLSDPKVGTIAIDSNYSPIERVNYEVEDARVGQDDSYDKLILYVWTDGSVSPMEAISKSASILISQLDQIDNPEFTDSIKTIMNQNSDDPKQRLLDLPIENLELSVRAYNCLSRAGINTVSDLIGKTENEMMRIRNLGKKSLKEVMDKVKELNLSFKNED